MSGDGGDTETRDTRSSKAGGHHVDFVVFGVTAALIVGFLVWGIVDKTGLKDVTANILAWITDNLGWMFILCATGFVLFAVFLAASKYGKIPLGRDGEKPEFKTVSWIAMMFSAGMGIGLMFYGANEPLTHYSDAPPGTNANDVGVAMATTMFHWGLHPWAMYAVVGLAIAYSTYRCGRGQLISAVFAPLLGNRANGWGGKVIDILAIFATLFGTVASLGLGAAQIGSGFEELNVVGESGKLLLVAVIAVLTAAFVASAVSGVAKGIQWLSNINMVLAITLALFIFVVGPTIFILNVVPTSIGSYAKEITADAARSGASTDAAGKEWLAGWTIFYWAWWVSWTPFVGMFLAKISRGRTIREFVIGVMVVPSSVSLVWFAIFGGTAISQEMDGKGLSESDGPESQLFDLLGNLPWAGIASVLVMVLVAIFFVSGADSASLVMATLSERGRPEPSRTVTIFWGVLTGAVAALLLWVSGDDALQGIKTMAIIAALPFVIVMILMCVSLYKDLRRDPLILAEKHRSDGLDDKLRVHANTIAATDDTNDVLPSDDLPVDESLVAADPSGEARPGTTTS
ncbi:BCCT family transporter [Williamsia phyllosphaerae]|uniref:Choline transporter n=1 Tax=Williamsia phyllosphaerae TaxID=885042 RepID=A0ABQ1V0T0_9NOCA|nr:BCCT family transporter [Williamsia phyllosphaerae]GGF33543.1 choline transporter [Williamsia phyllosphaerae]